MMITEDNNSSTIDVEKLLAEKEALRVKAQQLRSMSQELRMKNDELRAESSQLMKRSQQLREQEEDLKYRSTTFREREAKLQKDIDEINSKKEEIDKLRHLLIVEENRLKEKINEASKRENELSERDNMLSDKEKELTRREELVLLEEKAKSFRIEETEEKQKQKREKKVEKVKERVVENIPEVVETVIEDEDMPEPGVKRIIWKLRRLYRQFFRRDGKSKLSAAGAVLLILMIIFIIGFFSTNIVMAVITGRGNEVIVPDLYNMHFDVARKNAMEMDLFVQQIDHQYDDEIAQKRILSQSPEAGRKTKKNRTIEVVVSLGPELIRVPHLDNITEREASLRLDNIGLHLGEKFYRYSDQVDRDRIINSQPAADTFVPRGSKINVYISLGRLPAASDRRQRDRSLLDRIE